MKNFEELQSKLMKSMEIPNSMSNLLEELQLKNQKIIESLLLPTEKFRKAIENSEIFKISKAMQNFTLINKSIFDTIPTIKFDPALFQSQIDLSNTFLKYDEIFKKQSNIFNSINLISQNISSQITRNSALINTNITLELALGFNTVVQKSLASIDPSQSLEVLQSLNQLKQELIVKLKYLVKTAPNSLLANYLFKFLIIITFIIGIQNRNYKIANPTLNKAEIKGIFEDVHGSNTEKILQFVQDAPKELICSSDVNVRKTPRSNGQKMAVLKESTKVLVLEDMTKHYLVTYFDKETKLQIVGFVSKSYLRSK